MASKKKCEEALDLHAESISALPNVVGLGIVPESDTGSGARRFALAVYVERKVPSSELDPNDVVPKTVEVSGRGRASRVETRVIEQGVVQLE